MVRHEHTLAQVALKKESLDKCFLILRKTEFACLFQRLQTMFSFSRVLVLALREILSSCSFGKNSYQKKSEKQGSFSAQDFLFPFP